MRRPGFPNRKRVLGKEQKAVLTYMMFLMLPSHSAQIFPFLKYPMAQEPQYGPACDKECPPRRLAQGGREKNSRNQLKREAWYLRMRFRIRCKGL